MGPFFIVLGIGVLINHVYYAAAVAEAVHIPTLIYLSGLMSLLAGIVILNAYRAWTADWRVIITILGWLCAIGGFVRIVLPKVTVSLATTIYSGPAALIVVAIVSLILGCYLSFEGYRRSA